MPDRFYTGQDPDTFDLEYIVYEKDKGCATITFNLPAVLNCVNGPVLRELITTFRDVRWNDDIYIRQVGTSHGSVTWPEPPNSCP